MDSYERIAQAFHQRIDSITSAVDLIAAGLEAAGTQVVHAVLGDHKLFVLGCGRDGALARLIARSMRSPEHGGPALPALAIVSDEVPDARAVFWDDIRTLARDGDVLFCLDSHASAPLATNCAAFAAPRNLAVIALSELIGDFPGICMPIPATDPAIRSELMLMASHCLTEQIRINMLGE